MSSIKTLQILFDNESIALDCFSNFSLYLLEILLENVVLLGCVMPTKTLAASRLIALVNYHGILSEASSILNKAYGKFNQRAALFSDSAGFIQFRLWAANPSATPSEQYQRWPARSTTSIFLSTKSIEVNFLVVGGGGASSYNEVALEKNVLYFQRTLRAMGYNPEEVAFMLFANGNDGQATIRYIDNQLRQQFKAPEIPNLNGAATLTNVQRYFQHIARQNSSKPLFFYFTGHGGKTNKT